MAVNPYVVPARYQYQSLPANFLLEAGMRKQNQFDTANAGLEAFKSSLALTPGYKTVDRAKALEQNYLSQVQPLVDEFLQTGNAQSIVPKLSRLQSQFQSDPERRAIQNDFELKPLAAKAMSDPTLMDRGYHTITDAQGNVIQTKAGEEITPQMYGVLPEQEFRKNFDPVINAMKAEKGSWEGKPKTMSIQKSDGTYEDKLVTTKEEWERLNAQDFTNKISQYAQSERYKETPFYQWYSKKVGEMSPEEFAQTALNEYSSGFFDYNNKDLSVSNIGGSSGSGKGKEEQVPILQGAVEQPFEFKFKNPNADIIDSKDPLKSLLDKTSYDSKVVDDKLTNQGFNVVRDPETGDIQDLTSTTGKALSVSDKKRMILDANAEKAKAEGYTKMAKTLEDDLLVVRNQYGLDKVSQEDQNTLSTIQEIKDEQPGVFSKLKTLAKSMFDISSVTPQEMVSFGTKSYSDYVSIALRPKGFYEGVTEAEYAKADAVLKYAEQADKFSDIEKNFSKYKEKEAELVKNKLKGFDESLTAFVIEDYEGGRKDHVNLSNLINLTVDGGTARGVDPNAESPDFNTDNALKGKEFEEYTKSGKFKFDPYAIYFKEGKVFSRGKFKSKSNAEDAPAPSKEVDVDITRIMQDKLPIFKNVQEQVYTGIHDQMKFIPNGEQGDIKLFGNDVKVTKSQDGSSFDIAPNSFFEFNEKTGEMGLNQETKTYANSSEAAYDVLKGAVREEQLRQAKPYLFEEVSKDKFKYTGDQDPKEIEARKELVGKSSIDLAESFGWGEEYADTLNKIIGFESAGTYDTAVANKKDPTDHPAKGLIQFKPSASEYDIVGGNKEFYKKIGGKKYYMKDIEKMSIAEQMLGPVADYFEQFSGSISDPQELYLAVIQPAILTNPVYTAAKDINEKRKIKLGDLISSDAFYKANPSFKEDMTVGELLDKVYS